MSQITNEERQAVLRKVQKMLTLGKDKGAFEAESAAALAMASQFLAEHGLTMKDVEMDQAGTIKPEQLHERNSESMALWPWEKNLTHVVTCLLPVRLLWLSMGGGYKKQVWCGTPSDTELAQEVWFRLRAELKRLAKGERSPVEKRSFLTGAVEVLISRARQLKARQERPRLQAPGFALMVVKAQQVQAWVDKRYAGRLSPSRDRGSALDQESYDRGRMAGHSMPFGLAKELA